jgi:hypothetical protein
VFTPLAYAETPDSGSVNLVSILIALFVLAAVAVLAFIVIRLARTKQPQRTEIIMTLAIFWAVFTAGSLMYTQMTQMKWSKEYTVRLESGYLDPHDIADAPKLPLKTWTGLGVAYVALLGASVFPKR